MAGETIELAKNWDPKQAAKVLPAWAQVKYDGVPLKFIKQSDGSVIPFTRQGEVAVSVPNLCIAAEGIISRVGGSITAEVFLPGKPFKDSSGAVRKQQPNHDLTGVIFDFDIHNRPNDRYSDRYFDVKNALAGWTPAPGTLKLVDNWFLCTTVDQVEEAWDHLQSQHPGVDLEGMMLHNTNKGYLPGKRRWETARYKPQPVIDLEVVGFEEAVSEAGEGLGMVGRVNVRLLREWPLLPAAGALGKPETGWVWVYGDVYAKTVGVGPGKLSHADRIEWWNNQLYGYDHKLYAAIKYMPDPAYAALRQPTVQFLRTDKSESDVLKY